MAMERDPVCGMSVNPETAKFNAGHSGKTFYFCSAGCAQKFAGQPDRYATAEPARKDAAPVLPILAEGPKDRDPVCGMVVDPKKAAGKFEHRGKSYYFCSPRCAERFAK